MTLVSETDIRTKRKLVAVVKSPDNPFLMN